MSNENKNTSKLSDINKKIVEKGEILPEVKLKDGSVVQTGTVATMLYNINIYNQNKSKEIEEELIEAIPTLSKVGLFDLFPPDEWIKEGNSGRSLVGKHAKEYLKIK